LLVSESVPPQVNGIARRIGHYNEGLQKLGCKVSLIHPHSDYAWAMGNPWNCTSQMMVLYPSTALKLLTDWKEYDVVHVVLPLNISGCWIMAAFRLMRFFHTVFSGNCDMKHPALVVSWHCNTQDYVLAYFGAHMPTFVLKLLSRSMLTLTWMLAQMSDRILTPTRSTEPLVLNQWHDKKRDVNRAGVCLTGMASNLFHPNNKMTPEGQEWQSLKNDFLKRTGKKYLIVVVGRLAAEKGIDEMLKCMQLLNDCGLWLVGDGPIRENLEKKVKKEKLAVEFLGYQKGKKLYSVYTAGDIFVCPSLTETFGQTVNEALASEVRVALPCVSVFEEAYGEYIPKDAFWEPLNLADMARAITTQLSRHAKNSIIGLPNRTKLCTWSEACQSLMGEYRQAMHDVDLQYRKKLRKRVAFFLPVWYFLTLLVYMAVASLNMKSWASVPRIITSLKTS